MSLEIGDDPMIRFTPPPAQNKTHREHLTALIVALAALVLALPSAVMAQNACTTGTCTISVTGNINGYHVGGCGGDHLRWHLRLSSTNPAVAFRDFGGSTVRIEVKSQPTTEWNQLEWRREGGAWQNLAPSREGGYATFGTGALDQDLTLDIRAGAGAVIKGFGGNIGSGMMAVWIDEIRSNPKPYAVRKSRTTAFFSSGEGCGRSLPSGYNEPDGHLYEDGVRIR